MGNQELLEHVGCLSNVSIADMLEAFEKVGIKSIKEAKALPSHIGQLIEVQDDQNQCFYFGLSKFGFVEIVRKGTVTGEIVFVPLDD